MHVTVFEIYADKDGYIAHIQTPHFKKHKRAVEAMGRTQCHIVAVFCHRRKRFFAKGKEITQSL
jgi:quinol monooxygenase YgiN